MTYEAKSNSPLILKQKPHMVVCLVKAMRRMIHLLKKWDN